MTNYIVRDFADPIEIVETKEIKVIRSGTCNSLWAYTPCKRGFNYLSKIHTVEQIKPTYDGCECPICGKSIECNTELVVER